MKVIYFEDKGQDFLRWYVSDSNEIVGCEPFQAHAWCGRKIQPSTLAVGKKPFVLPKPGGSDRNPRQVNYSIIKIREA